jgi:HEAT repeat protein
MAARVEKGVSMARIFEIATHVSTPLALAGFIACVVFFVLRQIVAKDIFPRLTAAIGAGLLRLIIDRLFVLALVAMILGFGAYLVPLAFGASRPSTVATPASVAPAGDFDALSQVVRSQLDSHDYANAWGAVGEALKNEPARADVLDLQADVAMCWIRDVHAPDVDKFDDVVDPLVPVLYRTVQRRTTSDKPRAADALAHIGWANFLKERASVFGLDIEGRYREAVQLDPDNPFAHAMWGHWLIAHGDRAAEARTQFAAALKSGRERSFVRKMQIAAFGWVTSDENTFELIRVCNEMRKNGEPPPDEDRRSHALGDFYFMSRRAVFSGLHRIVPADEQLATFQWLRRGLEGTQSDRALVLARLAEAAGDNDTALRAYVTLLNTDGETLRDARDGIARCKRASPGSKSEVELLTESLNDRAADVRLNAISCLSALAADGDGRVELTLFVGALRDPLEDVRSAAEDTLARAGRHAVPQIVEWMESGDDVDRVRAARVLAKIGVESKAAVQSLMKMLKAPDDETRLAAIRAIGAIGPAAGGAAATITELLAKKPSRQMREELVWALGKFGRASEPAVPLIIEALRDKSDDSWTLHNSAAIALGDIGPGAASAVGALTEVLNSDHVGWRAAEALGNIGADAKAAVPALVEAMRDPALTPEARTNQAEAIGKIAKALAARNDRSSLEVLHAALRAEQEAKLDPATIAPLSEAVSVLAK